MRKIALLFACTASIYANNFSCTQNESIELFKHSAQLKLERAFSESDIEIFNKMFQIKNIKEIKHTKQISLCEVEYKIVPMDRNEALGYLYSLGNNYSEFKNILLGLSSDNEKYKKQLISQLARLSSMLPKTQYYIINDNKLRIRIEKFSIYELLKAHLRD